MSVPKPDKSALGITKRVTELGISDFEISEENVTYYWLEITCSPASDGQPVVYMIPKRFSEFYELKTEYAKKYRSVKFPHFPSRSVFSALSPKDLLSRQANLQGYMSFLSHHVILRDDPLLEDFLTTVRQTKYEHHISTILTGLEWIYMFGGEKMIRNAEPWWDLWSKWTRI